MKNVEPLVAKLTMSALRNDASESLASYASALSDACDSHRPPFGCEWYGDKYREFASDPNWLAESLVANAEKEGSGARTLWRLAGRVRATQSAELIRQHAIDESRHSLMYLSLLDLTFPGAVDEDVRGSLRDLSPMYRPSDMPQATDPIDEDTLLDEVIQMNIGEIRTRIHQMLMRPVLLAMAPDQSADRVAKVLDSLMIDETAHILYTARLIDVAMMEGRETFARSVMKSRLNEFNEITLSEVGERRFVGE